MLFRSSIVFQDRVYGRQCFYLPGDTGDFIVRRSDGVFAYHLAVVADDHAQGVTEIVRGCDLLPATAPQLLLYDRLGFPRPQYAHVPLLVASDGSRLCKRDKALDLGALQASGMTPERVLGLLGAASGLLVETMDISLPELLERFDWRKIPQDNIRVPLQ